MPYATGVREGCASALKSARSIPMDWIDSTAVAIGALWLVWVVVWIVGGSAVGIVQYVRDQRRDGLPVLDAETLAVATLIGVILAAAWLAADAVGPQHGDRGFAVGLAIALSGFTALGVVGRQH